MADQATVTDIEKLGIATIRGLAMDAPNAARSGHQGTAMALAPLAHVLYTRIMKYDAAEPLWPDRDRFVLSAGHASILQYSLLHLTGFGLTLDDLRAFRQWGSATPGHPEVGHTAGVEVTTGPLGQGISNAVGMAVAERWLRKRFGTDIVDHHTFAICGDGDLSEGVSHEAASFAGHQQLGRLVCVYDDNHITIDGPTELSLTDDAAGRFRAYGWHVIELGEAGEDLDALEGAIREAMAVEDKPSLVIVRTHIAFPSPGQTDNPHAHGYSLFDEEIAATKEVLGLPQDQTFFVPDEVLAYYRAAGALGAEARIAWDERYESFEEQQAFEACIFGVGLDDDWAAGLPVADVGASIATRKASGNCLSAAVLTVPGLVAGGADLTGNTGTALSSMAPMSAAEPAGRQIHFGVREHAMGSIMNGMAMHGGLLPVGGTFLVFADYMRPSVRLAALTGAKVIYSFTHDSVAVGEDGPTHQPVEQVMSLRAIPDLRVIRPADANETAGAWRVAVDSDGPTALILTRQDVAVLEGTSNAPVDRGAYVLHDTEDAELTLIGTGSEVQLCVAAAQRLAEEGINARVVSMPSWELFDEQDDDYQAWVLPDDLPTVSIEAGVTLGWHRYADIALGIDDFGASAPGDEVMREYGMTVDAVVAAATFLIGE